MNLKRLISIVCLTGGLLTKLASGADRIDFVKDEGADWIGCGQHHLDRQHDAG